MKKASLFMIVLFILPALFGCAQKAGINSVSEGSSIPQSTDSSPSSAEKIPLTVSIFDRGKTTAEFGSVTENRYIEWIREEFGVPNHIDVQFYAIPREQESSKLNALMAAKEAPDICITYSSSIFYQYAKQGGLSSLDDAIAEYGANISSNLKEGLPYGQYQGQQYSVYALRAARDMAAHYVRKDWLDALGFSMRTNESGLYTMSVDELYEALLQFKEKDLDGTGQQIFSLGMNGKASQMWPLGWSFLDVSQITEEDWACLPDWMLSGAKDAYRWLNKVYHEGLMDPDYATTSEYAKKIEYIVTGRTGYWADSPTFELNSGAGLDALYSDRPTAEVVAFQLENIHGDLKQKVYSPIGLCCMVPVFSEAVNEAVMYMDFLADYKNDRVLRYGFEGENYTMTDGVPANIRLDYENLSDYALMYNGDPDPVINTATSIASLPEFTKPIRTDTLKLGVIGGVNPYAFQQEIISETKYGADLDAKLSELTVKSVMAAPDEFDATFDALAEEYLNIGGQEVIDEKIAVYRKNEGK